MKFVNAYEIRDLNMSWGANSNNIGRAVRLLAAVAEHANENSDGWHSWPKPCRACRSLIELLDRCGALRVTWGGTAPAQPTDEELRKAIAPIRAFYTRTRAKVPSYPEFPIHALRSN